MNKTLTALTILTAVLTNIQQANAHMEPKKEDGFEKCYGIAKAHKNDCTSKRNRHACATMGSKDADPNEWIKLPIGLCEKLVGGSIKPEDKA